VAWKVKLYQEWKGKDTKKAYIRETTKNDEYGVDFRVKKCWWSRAEKLNGPEKLSSLHSMGR